MYIRDLIFSYAICKIWTSTQPMHWNTAKGFLNLFMGFDTFIFFKPQWRYRQSDSGEYSESVVKKELEIQTRHHYRPSGRHVFSDDIMDWYINPWCSACDEDSIREQSFGHTRPTSAGIEFEYLDRCRWEKDGIDPADCISGQSDLSLFFSGLVTGLPAVGVPNP